MSSASGTGRRSEALPLGVSAGLRTLVTAQRRTQTESPVRRGAARHSTPPPLFSLWRATRPRSTCCRGPFSEIAVCAQ